MNLDLTPLFRSSIGFDRMARLLDQAARTDQSQISYPPYNIEAINDNQFRITLALAGFSENELEITSEENTLTVKGRKETEVEGNFIHRGIATRSFERRFQLADHVNVKGASMQNGLLNIELEREVPEAMKPRTIAIKNNGSALTDASEKQAKEVA